MLEMFRPVKWGLRFEILVSLGLLAAAAVGFVGLFVLKYTQREMLALKVQNGLVLAKAMEEQLDAPHPERLQVMVGVLAQTGFERIVPIHLAFSIQLLCLTD